MFQGFYTLGSAMISQNRNLNVISNNISNVSTPGYKADTYVASTFREEMLYRSGNQSPNKKSAIGSVNGIQATNDRVTDYEQGAYDITDMPLDFTIDGDGFFVVQMGEKTVYSRNGSFITDDEGYLSLSGVGRVVGTNGLIKLPTDDITVAENGAIWDTDTGEYYGTIQLVNFEDYEFLIKSDNGTFTAEEGAQTADPNAIIRQGMLERSNVSMVEEMVSMMSSQRALQSAAQVLTMYDQLNAKSVQIGSM